MLDARNVQSECSSDVCSGGQGAEKEKKQAAWFNLPALDGRAPVLNVSAFRALVD
jgi:hypothetical protein